MSKVRISVANLALDLIVKGTEKSYKFGITPKKRIQALGGAVWLTELGVRMLQTSVGAENFEFDKASGFADARFLVPESMVEHAFYLFTGNGGFPDTRHEKNPFGDMETELSGKEYPNAGHILPSHMLGLVRFQYRTMFRQQPPESGRGTSERERTDVPTRRLFRFWNIRADQMAADIILSSPLVRILSDDELATTKGGACKGVAKDGTEIADNLFLVQ